MIRCVKRLYILKLLATIMKHSRGKEPMEKNVSHFFICNIASITLFKPFERTPFLRYNKCLLDIGVRGGGYPPPPPPSCGISASMYGIKLKITSEIP